jgi:hypothetical protein
LGDDYNFTAESSLQRVEGSVGWEHVIAKHFLVRWDIGGSYTFAASAKIKREFNAGWPLNGLIDDAAKDVENDLEETLQKHVNTPILAVGVGWRFQ